MGAGLAQGDDLIFKRGFLQSHNFRGYRGRNSGAQQRPGLTGSPGKTPGSGPGYPKAAEETGTRPRLSGGRMKYSGNSKVPCIQHPE